MEKLSADVKDLILQIVNDAMREQDRYVTINFLEAGPFVTVTPLMIDNEEIRQEA